RRRVFRRVADHGALFRPAVGAEQRHAVVERDVRQHPGDADDRDPPAQREFCPFRDARIHAGYFQVPNRKTPRLIASIFYTTEAGYCALSAGPLSYRPTPRVSRCKRPEPRQIIIRDSKSRYAQSCGGSVWIYGTGYQPVVFV